MTLEEAWETFVELYTKGSVEEAQRFYLTEVWPELVKRWREKPRGDIPTRPYRKSVHTLGTSPEAAVLAALALGSQDVHLLYTSDTEKHLPFVAEWTGVKVTGHLVDREDPRPIYQTARELTRPGGEPVAFDMTGGTKVMGAALMAMGFVLAKEGALVDVFYLSSDAYDPKVRKPRSYSERLTRVPAP